MIITLSTNAQTIADSLSRMDKPTRRAMQIALFRAVSILEAEIKLNIRSRSGLRVRTGTLLNSIQHNFYISKDEFNAEIGPRNVPYAAILEFGGVIPSRFVKPIRKQSLKFIDKTGATRFSKGHFIPATRIPAYPYLSPAVEANADKILDVFGVFIEEELKFNRR